MSIPTLPAFGVSEFTTWPWTFERDVETYARLGVDAIEVCEFKLNPANARAQLESIASAGLTISSVQPKLHSLFPDEPRPEPVEPAERMARVRGTIELFAPIAPGTTLVSITGAAPVGNYRHAFETAVREYRALAEFAGEHGVRIAIEPLNPILMNVDTFICTLPEAMEIVAAVDQPNFGVFADVWHVWPDPAAERHIRECGEKVFGVHVNDWHRPRHFGDRVSMGKGQIQLGPLFRAIHESGYSGAYTLEMFSVEHLPDSLWKSDLEAVLRENLEAFPEIWNREFGGVV